MDIRFSDLFQRSFSDIPWILRKYSHTDTLALISFTSQVDLTMKQGIKSPSTHSKKIPRINICFADIVLFMTNDLFRHEVSDKYPNSIPNIADVFGECYFHCIAVILIVLSLLQRHQCLCWKLVLGRSPLEGAANVILSDISSCLNLLWFFILRKQNSPEPESFVSWDVPWNWCGGHHLVLVLLHAETLTAR